MWRCVQEWFAKIASLSRACDVFCLSVCQAGILQPLRDIISNEQIQEAHLRNNVSHKLVIMYRFFFSLKKYIYSCILGLNYDGMKQCFIVLLYINPV